MANYSLLSKIIKANSINIIHCQNRIPALYASIYCFFHKRVQYVWANHKIPIPSDFLHRFTTKYGKCAIASCLESQQLLTEKLKVPKQNVKTVLLGCDIYTFKNTSKSEQDSLKKNLGIKQNEKVLFLYGRLTKSKGHLFLIDALKNVKTNQSYKIIFPGEGSQDYITAIKEAAKDVGLLDRIIMPGFVKGRDFLSISDLMLLPSEYEGFPIACIEAFVMGTPVIRTKTGGYEDTKQYCFGVDYGDTIGLTNLLQDFFDGKTKFKERALYAQRNKEEFGVDRMVSKYLAIYERALS